MSGLSLHSLVICPHYDTEPKRKLSLKRTLKRSNKIGIALEECTALEIVDETYRIIASEGHKKAYKAYWNNGKYYIEILKPTTRYNPLTLIASK